MVDAYRDGDEDVLACVNDLVRCPDFANFKNLQSATVLLIKNSDELLPQNLQEASRELAAWRGAIYLITENKQDLLSTITLSGIWELPGDKD